MQGNLFWPWINKIEFFKIHFFNFFPNFCQLFRAFKFDIFILILYLYYFLTKSRGRTKSLNAPNMWKLCSALKGCLWIAFEWVCCHGFGPTWIFFWNVSLPLQGNLFWPWINKFEFFKIYFFNFFPNFCQLFRAFKFDIFILILYLYYFSNKCRGRTKS